MPLARGGDSVLAEARRPTGLRVTGRARPACPGRAGSVAVGSPAEPEGTAGGRGCSVGAGLRAGPATACLSPRAGGHEQRCGSPVGARAVAGAGRSFVFPVCRGPGSDNLLPRPCPWPSGLGAQDMCRSHVLRPQTLGPLGGREARPPAASVWRAAVESEALAVDLLCRALPGAWLPVPMSGLVQTRFLS